MRGIVWRHTLDGRPVKPQLLPTGDVAWWEWDGRSWVQLDEPTDPDRMGEVETITTSDGRELATLNFRATIFNDDGSNPELIPGEDDGEFGKIRMLKVPMTSRQGIEYTDDQVRQAVALAVAEAARDVRADCVARFTRWQHTLSRAVLKDRGVIEDERERIGRVHHDKRRRVASAMPCVLNCEECQE